MRTRKIDSEIYQPLSSNSTNNFALKLRTFLIAPSNFQACQTTDYSKFHICLYDHSEAVAQL